MYPDFLTRKQNKKKPKTKRPKVQSGVKAYLLAEKLLTEIVTETEIF